jgi:ribosomal protein L11 methyltransferase
MIDWVSQWAAFAPNFYDGLAHIDLSPQGVLLLEPGEGFGDLSHETTRLMIDLMRPLVANHVIVDIGCGSGILSLAALILGARKAYGIDIDPLAVSHAKRNALINHLDKKAFFSRQLLGSKRIGSPSIILMNMIFSEQRVAYRPILGSEWLITSGLLESEKRDYFKWISGCEWEIVQEKKEGEWMGFVFQNLNHRRKYV